MFQLSKLTVAKRLLLLIVSACLGILVLAGIFMVSERSLLMRERSNAVQQAVDTAHGILQYYQRQVSEGKITDCP